MPPPTVHAPGAQLFFEVCTWNPEISRTTRTLLHLGQRIFFAVCRSNSAIDSDSENLFRHFSQRKS